MLREPYLQEGQVVNGGIEWRKQLGQELRDNMIKSVMVVVMNGVTLGAYGGDSVIVVSIVIVLVVSVVKER